MEAPRIKQFGFKDPAQTFKHESTKQPFNKSMERAPSNRLSAKQSFQFKSAIRESLDSQTNGTEKAYRQQAEIHKDSDVRTDLSDVTEIAKNVKLSHGLHH